MNPVNTKPYQLPENATWLITGCSSGIGKELATYVAAQPGQRVVATARSIQSLSFLPDDNDKVFKLALDVKSPSSVDAAFEAAVRHFGYLDVVVNNAGYSLAGDTEAVTEEAMHDHLETNFFGTVRVTINAIKLMRQSKDARGGLIFNMSSVAGVCAFPGVAFYHAGKFAVEGFTESVAREMHPDWNINFCLIEPGAVKTNFEGSSKAIAQPHEAYASPDMPARQLDALLERALKAGAGVDPLDVAKTLFLVASRGEKIPLRLPLTVAAVGLIKAKLKGQLEELDKVDGLAGIDKGHEQFF